VVHHFDQGTQYTSIAFGLRCRGAAFTVRADVHQSARRQQAAGAAALCTLRTAFSGRDVLL
jgi:hypothetical protein